MTGETLTDRVTPLSWSDEDEWEMRGRNPSESCVILRRRPTAERSVQRQTVCTKTLEMYRGAGEVLGTGEIEVLTNR